MSLNIELLRESFEAVKPVAVPVVEHFYKTLFSKYPQAKPLFKNVDMGTQKGHLINSLVFIVDHVDKAEQLVPYLQKMGARHLKYGVQNEHYAWVGGSLIETFKHFFKDQWSQELESTWLTAFGVIAQQMQEGAKAFEANSAASQTAESQSVESPTTQKQSAESHTGEAKTYSKENVVEIFSSIEKELRSEFKPLVKNLVRKMIEEEFEAQTKSLMSKIKKAA